MLKNFHAFLLFKTRGLEISFQPPKYYNSTFATAVLAAREPVCSNLTDLIASPFVKTTTVVVSRPAA